MTEFATTTDGLRIAYDRVGEGPPVVLVHGFGSWWAVGSFGGTDTLAGRD